MSEQTIDTQDIKRILQKLDDIEKNSQKTWMASLTEQSALMIDTHEIAVILSRSYDYTYKYVVSLPDFPKPSKLGDDIKKHQSSIGRPSRRWISGEVIQYLRSKGMLQ